MNETKTVLEPADLLSNEAQCIGITGKGDRCSNRGRIIAADGHGVVCALHARAQAKTLPAAAPAPEVLPVRPRQVQRLKMRAQQRLFYDNHLIEEGEVYVFVGDRLPKPEIAVPVDLATPLGVPREEPLPPGQTPKQPPPSWTTKGYIDAAQRRAGYAEAGAELLT